MRTRSSAVRPVRLRRIGLAAVAVSAVAGGVALPTPSASAAADPVKVVVFDDPAYVDVNEEGQFMQDVLTEAGDTVTTVETSTPAALTAALVGQQAFVIPETERGSVAGFDAESITVIQDYVRAGGTLVFGGDYEARNINSVFGTTTTGVYGDASYALAAAPSPAFVGGPTEIPSNSATVGFTDSTLPANATAEYSSQVDGTTAVYDFVYGAGTVYNLGWDWYDALTVSNPSGANGGWNDVLQRAVGTVADPTPTPPAGDTSAPQTTITKITSKKVDATATGSKARAKVTIAFKADEPSTFECRVDGSAYAPCSSPLRLKLKATKHYVKVRATDTAGNLDATPASRIFRVQRAKA